MAASINTKQPPENRRMEKFRLPRKKSSIAGPLMFFLVMVAIIFVMSVFFRVSDVKVEGNLHYTDEEIIRALDIEQGDNLFFFDRFAALSRAFAKLPYIEEVTIERKLPNKVKIIITESEALAYIPLGDELWTFDHSCKMLGKATADEDQKLIPVVGLEPGTLLIGEKMNIADGNEATVDYLAEVLGQLEGRELNSSVTRIDFSDPQNVKFSYGGKYTVVLGSNRDTDRKMGMFVSVMSKLKEGDMGIIDVSDGSVAHFRPY